MTSIKPIALVSVFYILTAFAASGENLLKNPSFEELMLDTGDQAADWSRWGQWLNREMDWTPVRDGRALIAYHHWRIEDSGDSGMWQDVANVKAGKRYTFSVYANADTGQSGRRPPREVELRLESTLNGRQVVINSRKFLGQQIAQGERWSRLEISGTAASDTLRALIIVYPARKSDRDGAIKLDQASLEPALHDE